MYKIVIDPGHGGTDPGACNGNLQEKNINLAAALEISRLLSNSPFQIHLTRSTDKPLSTIKSSDLSLRGTLGKAADLFISLHCDAAARKTARGFSLYRNFDSPSSDKFSLVLKSKYSALSSLPCFGLFTKPNSAGNDDYYGVLRPIPSKVPALIFEMGFISNSDDLKVLTKTSFPSVLANSLQMALTEYFNVQEVDVEIDRLNKILDDKRKIIIDQGKIIDELRKENEALRKQLKK